MDGSGMVTAAGSGMVGTAAMGNVGGADVDSGDTLSYAVGTQASHGTLTVDPATGAWTYMVNEDDAAVQALGAGETAMDTGTIVISDDQGGSATVEVEITITGIVDMPTVNVTTDTVAENDAMGPNLAEVTSPDTGVTFSVDNPAFEIIMVGSTHVLKLKDGHSLDHEASGGSVTLMVTASDSNDVTSHAAEVVINVTDVNEAPMITAADGAVNENAAGATVGAVMVSDYDAADAGLGDANISVSDDRFEVVGGMLKLKDGVSLDHESEDSVTVTVTVTDTGTNGDAISASAEVEVTVNDLNEAPTVKVENGTTPDGMMARPFISENMTGAIGQINGTDEDDGAMLTYTVSDDRFMVEMDDMGDYWLKLAQGVDFETEQSVTVTVTASDGELSGTFDVTVTISDADEDPTIEVSPQEIVKEDTPNQVVATVMVNDVDAKDSLGAGNITVDDERFGIRAKAEMDGTITINLVLNQAIDADTLGGATVPVTLTVADTGNNKASVTIDVVVSGDNEMPSITIGNGVTPEGMAANGMADENMADVPIAKITASDPEQGALNHDSLTIVDENGMEVTDGPFMITPDPEDGVSWLKLATAQDFETDGGTHTVIVRVTDAGDPEMHMDQSYTVTINNVNEAPMASDGSGAVTAGGEMPATATGEIMPMDYDADTTFTYDGQEAAMYGELMIGDDGSWTYTVDDTNMDVLALREGATLTDTIEVTVTDSGIPGSDGSTMHTMATITVTITGVNDDPMVMVGDGTPPGGAPTTGTINEMTADNKGTGAVRQINISDYEDAISAQDIIDSGMMNDDGSFSVNGFTVTASDERFIVQADAEGGLWLVLNEGQNYDGMDGVKSIDVTISVEDSEGGMAEAMTTITIMNVNEPPTITFDDELPSIDENTTGLVGTFTISDPEDAADTSEFDIEDVSVVTEGFEVVEAGVSGKYELRLKAGYEKDHEMTDSVSVTLLIEDTQGLSPAEPIIVDVAINDIDEPPTVSVDGLTTTVDENVNMEMNVDLGQIMAHDQEDGALMPTIDPASVDADRFMIMNDDEGNPHLYLKGGEDMVADHETDASLSITLVVNDSSVDNESVKEDFTLTIADVNEKPEPVGKLEEENLMAGDQIMWEIDLTALFEDQDVDDNNLVYSLNVDPGLMSEKDKTIPLSLTVQRTMVDGEEKITGTISSGDEAIWSRIVPGSFDVTVVATDDGDPALSGEVSITVHVDDRNDEITDVRLYDEENMENVSGEIRVDEDENGEVNFGRIVVDDVDSPMHPHGQHDVKVDEDSKAKGFEVRKDDDGEFWLILNAGSATNLDHETDGELELTITASDMADPASTDDLMVTVVVNDKNEKPTAIQEPGNWWVTVNEDLDADNVGEGDWLSFKLDLTGSDAAFMDEDDPEQDNGKLTFEKLAGPSWLLVKEDGTIVNDKMMVPDSDGGREMVTIQATDGGGLMETMSFYLTWAVSGEDNEDNDDPTLKVESKSDVDENSGPGTVVATITVDDDDSHLIGHPFAPGKPMITTVVNSDTDEAITGAFTIERKGTSDVWEVKTTAMAKDLLDHETVDDITITVQVSDGTGESDDIEIDIDVDDVPESPMYAVDTKSVSGVDQSESEKILVWINVYDAWEDPDDNDDDKDLVFAAASDTPWITVLQQPGEKWEDLMEGKDGDSGTADDWAWGNHPDYSGAENVFIGDPPGEDDKVALVLIDRTGDKNQQADVAKGGSFTLTATDEAGKKGTQTIMVPVMDENEVIGDDAVTITGGTREGQYLTAHFDETKDPDLVGSAESYMVVYTFYAVGDGVEDVRQVSTSDRYMTTQEDVGMKIKVSVSYRELFDGEFVEPENGVSGGEATTTSEIRNHRDDGSMHVNVLTNAQGLDAEVQIMDMDVVPTDGVEYIWQESVNGIQGWKEVAGDDKSDAQLVLADGGGKYYRLVVEYTDNQGDEERIVMDRGDIVQVGALSASSPEIVGSAVVGGTLRVDGASGAVVVWQRQVDPVENESGDEYWVFLSSGQTLSLGSDHSGETLRAVVTTSGANGITARQVVQVNNDQPITGPVNTPPNKVKDHDEDHELDDGGVTTIQAVVPLASLFEDLDNDVPTFTAGPGNGNAPADSQDTAPTMYIGGNDQGLISFDATNGELLYITDEKSAHDGNDDDAGGNVVTFQVTASDGNGGEATADVNIRLNVAPTEIQGDATGTVSENGQVAEDLIANLNVQDENSPMHEFGQYAWKIMGDESEKFEVVKDESDSSQAVLKVKEGQTFEATADRVITLTIEATEVGNPAHKVTLEVTITVTNDTRDDPVDPPGVDDDDGAPGLEDDEGDTDTDGGVAPAMMTMVAMVDDGLF